MAFYRELAAIMNNQTARDRIRVCLLDVAFSVKGETIDRETATADQITTFEKRQKLADNILLASIPQADALMPRVIQSVAANQGVTLLVNAALDAPTETTLDSTLRDAVVNGFTSYALGMIP